MAKASAWRGLAPTAASTRQPRARFQASSLPFKKTANGKKMGRPPKSLKDGSAAKTSIAVVGGSVKKRGRCRQSVACKALKLKKTAKAAKGEEASGDGGDEEDTEPELDDGPEPTEVYNDELGMPGLEWETEKILDSKIKKGIRHYLVKWAGYAQSTWEPEVHLRNSTDLIAEFDEEFPNKP